jgi:hypothetical protein
VDVECATGGHCPRLREGFGNGPVRDAEGSNVLLFSESAGALADVGQRADVVIGQLALQHEAAQGVALPGWAVLGPLKEFLEDSHLSSTE